jgi:hypothetical protein
MDNMDCCNMKGENGCCATLNKMKGGNKKMNTRITLWAVIGVMFVATLFLTFKAGAVGTGVETVQAAGAVAKSAASSGMVGGC